MPVRLTISKGRKKTVVKLPALFIDTYMPKVNGDYLRVYLYCLKLCLENTELTDTQIAKNLGILKNDIKNAWKFWEKEGLITISEDGLIEFENPEEVSYVKKVVVEEQADFNDIFSVVKKDKKFKKTIQIIESLYCELLTQNDVLLLYDILVKEKIPLEIFMETLSHCIENNKKNIKYIAKVVSGNYSNGINTVELVEEYFRDLKENNQFLGQIKKVLQLKNRSLIDSEKEFINKWKDANKSIDDIKMAYEKTVMNTGKLSFPYMDKIIMNENGNKPVSKPSIKAGPLNNFKQELPDFNKITSELIKRQQT